MAVYTEGNHITRQGAASDYSGNQFKIVKLSSGLATLATASSDKIVGVIANKPDTASGSPIDIAIRSGSGSFKVIAGGSISAGDYLTATTGGLAVATTTNGHEVFGMALQDADTSDVFEYMKCNFRY